MYLFQIPTLIRLVYCYLLVHEFLNFISNLVASIVIWSSMKKPTMEQVAQYHFHHCLSSFAILDQDHCNNIEICKEQFVLVSIKRN